MQNKIFSILTILVLMLVPTVLAQEDEDINLLGFDLEELLSLVNGIIAFILFIFAFTAYKVDGRKRFLYVSMAFLLFSIKSLLDSTEIFGIEIESLGSIAVILEFLVLLIFFFGVVKRED
jgi:hypothetical protein